MSKLQITNKLNNFKFLPNFISYNIFTSLIPMQRLQNLELQLVPKTIGTKNPDDVVICSAVRTPLTKAKKGLLKDTAP
jgi:hypothetical protein